MAAGSTLCRVFIYIHHANRGISGRVINQVWGVLLSFLVAVTCAVGELDTLLKYFMDTRALQLPC